MLAEPAHGLLAVIRRTGRVGEEADRAAIRESDAEVVEKYFACNRWPAKGLGPRAAVDGRMDSRMVSEETGRESGEWTVGEMV